MPLRTQAAMRGVKQAAMTQPEADDPLKEMYGDLEMVQSKTSATKAFTRVEDLEPSLAGQQVGSSNCGQQKQQMAFA